MGAVTYWDEAVQSWVKTQAPKVDSYSKTETDALLDGTYTKEEIDERFAPAGYGLGTTTHLIDSMENVGANGFYQSSVDVPFNGGWLVTGYRSKGDSLILQGYHITDAGMLYSAIGERAPTDESITWYLENPPMKVGTEYCTTERFDGLPVYVKWIESGWMAAGEHDIEHEIANVKVPLDIKFYNNYAENLTNSEGTTHLKFTRSTISYKSDFALGNVAFVLKYTKFE